MQPLATRWLVLPLVYCASLPLLAADKPTKPLNDTGITTCVDVFNNRLSCPVSDYPNQDAEAGRDDLAAQSKLKKIGGGHSGFDFSKIANDGSVLPAYARFGSGAKDWACTRDNVTGLLWEIKTNDGGLRDQDSTFSWYNPNKKTNGGNAGYQNQGNCTGGIACNTYAYAQAVNKHGLCGKKDWRLPSLDELDSLINYDFYSPAIDRDYFPDLPDLTLYTTSFWSSPSEAADYAWAVNFKGGSDSYEFKGSSQLIRLVRAGQ